MRRFRVIPILLIQDGGLVKGERFRKHRYVGDPINAVKIFNEKEVDELAVLDISAGVNGRQPDYTLIEQIAGEAFMPVSYGGGLKNLEQVRRILQSGIEKAIFNASAANTPDLIRQSADTFGSSSTIVAIDVKGGGLFGGKKVFIQNGQKNTGEDPVTYARKMEMLGAGEIILTSIDREGTGEGYDLKLVEQMAGAVGIPLIANGGAGSVAHMHQAIEHGASAVAAGNIFVFHGKHRAVLISYPDSKEIFKND